jgi:hypothetical protein
LPLAETRRKRRRPVRNTSAASGVLKVTNTGRPDMFRALTILAAVVALTVSAAPAVGPLAVSAAPASAATSKKKAPPSGTGVGRVGGKMHLEDVSLGIITDL